MNGVIIHEGKKYVAEAALAAASCDPLVIANSALMVAVGTEKGAPLNGIITLLLASYAAHVTGAVPLVPLSPGECAQIEKALPGSGFALSGAAACQIAVEFIPAEGGTRIQITERGGVKNSCDKVYRNAIIEAINRALTDATTTVKTLGLASSVAPGGPGVSDALRRAAGSDTPPNPPRRSEPGRN